MNVRSRTIAMSGETELDVHKKIAGEFHEVFIQDGFGRAQDRSKVLEALLGHEDHVGAKELTEEVAAEDSRLNYRFVEQVLDQLVHYGLATPIRGEDGLTRYEHLHIGRHHDHIICVNCGQIVEVNCLLEDQVAALAKKAGFHAVHTHLQIHGICPTCVSGRPVRFSLDRAAAGEKIRVVELGGGREMRQQLVSMGLRIGATARRQNTNWFGPIIVSVGTTRMAIGRGMAKKVIVEEVDDGKANKGS